MKSKRKILILSLSILLTLGIIIGACAVYVSIYYKADTDAVEAFLSSGSVMLDERDDFTAFIPRDDAKTGFVFYPGGKVEYKAYYPLMQTLAEYGIFSAVVKMPFNLAVLDSDAADMVTEEYPEIKEWFIGGHSLGGAMAAAHIAKNESSFRGLVLLGAYSTKDLSNYNVSALSVYGTNDKVMNREKYETGLSYMPKRFTERVIDGGCHAYFGMYGEQKGDGTPTISNNEQIYITATHIYSFITAHG